MIDVAHERKFKHKAYNFHENFLILINTAIFDKFQNKAKTEKKKKIGYLYVFNFWFWNLALFIYFLMIKMKIKYHRIVAIAIIKRRVCILN